MSFSYRPPNSSAVVLDDLCTYFETVDLTQFANFIVVGDFNIDVPYSGKFSLVPIFV
jgi:hypothetical protein